MFSILALGFLIGMRHTLEAAHVAAVAALTARAGSVRNAVPLGLAWGAGHTVTLTAFALAVLVLEAAIPDFSRRQPGPPPAVPERPSSPQAVASQP